MRQSERPDDQYTENGTVQVWQWLGFNRFFPPDRGDKPIPKVMRGTASDYRNSESFKILSAYHLPLTALHAAVYTSPTHTHDPLLLVPVGKTVRVFNITHFQPRPPVPFPLEEEEVVALTKRMRLGEGEDDEPAEEGGAASGSGQRLNVFEEDAPREEEDRADEEADEEDQPDNAPEWDAYREGYMGRHRSRLLELFTAVEGWDIDLAAVDAARRAELPDIRTCEVASGGKVILGAGEKGTLYVWRIERLRIAVGFLRYRT
ncbi:hypothetical protein EVJ58_g10978 [Rhodofomes roseus]|uniref:Uncharacterized protein n=1 Tax=Rhodofomes roseus TaxID=34475 RepID=A0A4Y9XN32_9APHY|nr:hypothetical protein EVJ58_g10978 [Rhodofomes roseus]